MIKSTEIDWVTGGKEGFGFRISWFDDEKGFGNIDVFYNEEQGFALMTESMSKDFVKNVLNTIVDGARIIG